MTHYLKRIQNSIINNWDHKALCDYGADSFTYGELAISVKKFHLLFRALGINKGDRIAICAKNQARWGVCFLAINTYEAVAVPVLADFTAESVSNIVSHAECVMLFTDREIWDRLDKSKLPYLRQAVCVADFSLLWGDAAARDAIDSLEDTYAAAYPAGLGLGDIDFPTDNDSQIAVINYTSGSTGDPKGVILRYECLSANMDFSQKRIPNGPSDNLLSILPMAHMFGMAIELIYPLCGGATVYFLGKAPSPSVLMKAMQEVRPYLVMAVPMVFEKIYRSKLKPVLDNKAVKVICHIPFVREILFNKMRRSLDDAFGGRVREFIIGGAAFNPEVESFLYKIHWHFTVGYGMTEAAPLLCYEDWDKFALRSCGKAIDCTQLRIDSADPQNEVGEIQARGVNIFSGYFKNDQATKAAFTPDGWFRTGDLGLIDKNGNIYIKGRSKCMLLSSSGQNIYPEEIECIINNIPDILESLVVSREGKLVALVYPDEKSLENKGREPGAFFKDLLAQINAKMPKYSQITSIEAVKKPFEKTPKLSIKRFLYK